MSSFPLYFTAGPSVRQKREAFNKVCAGPSLLYLVQSSHFGNYNKSL